MGVVINQAQVLFRKNSFEFYKRNELDMFFGIFTKSWHTFLQ